MPQSLFHSRFIVIYLTGFISGIMLHYLISQKDIYRDNLLSKYNGYWMSNNPPRNSINRVTYTERSEQVLSIDQFRDHLQHHGKHW